MDGQILFILAIACFAIDAVKFAFVPASIPARVGWVGAGLALFATAIMLA